ncbi:stage II sporulation protein M [bacterium]|nr:MAG: stage II sporulation protein M [bacterium]
MGAILPDPLSTHEGLTSISASKGAELPQSQAAEYRPLCLKCPLSKISFRKSEAAGATMRKAMNEKSFVERRETEWRRLGELCDKAVFRAGALTPAQFREFLTLYRRTARDLSLARTQSDNVGLIDFLNDLVGRAYAILYRAPARSFLQSLQEAVEMVASTFRRRFAFVAASFGILVFGVLFSYITMSTAPATREFFVPPGLESSFEMWKSGEFPKEERSGGEGALATGGYVFNNPKVAMVTGALGAGTFGLFTLYNMWATGTMMGSLFYETNQVGHLSFVTTAIAPHGVPEISGMIVSGAAGLLLGWALLFPGRQSRASSLRAAGKDAMVLLAGSIVLMFIAAPIEGFFSFDPGVPRSAKVAVALVETVAWIAFWVYVGREKLAVKLASRIRPASAAKAEPETILSPGPAKV